MATKKGKKASKKNAGTAKKANAKKATTKKATTKKATTKKPQGRPKSGKGIGALARTLLLKDTPYSEILVEIKKQYPKSNTTLASLRWYASNMTNEGGVTLPKRRRAATAEPKK